MKKSLLFLTLILVFTVILFIPSLNLDFISDDYFFLGINDFTTAFRLLPGFYHFIPIFWLFIYIQKIIFGLNPFWFHAVGLFIHLINVYLVFIISLKISLTKKASLTASLFFASFFSHYEVLFWVTGQATNLMVIFYLLGLLFFAEFVNFKKFKFILLYYLFFCLSFLNHEYALSLPLVSFLYFFFFAKKQSIKTVFLVFVFPLIIAFVVFSIRIFVGKPELLPAAPLALDIIKSLIISLLYLFTSQASLIDNLPDQFIILMLFILLVYLILSKKNKADWFLLFWSGVTIALFSVTSFPQARYFYLSCIPSVLFISNKILKTQRFVGFTVLLLIISTNILFLADQYIYWSISSKIVKNTKTFFSRNSRLIKSDSTISIFNVPDRSNSGPWVAYVWRNGLNNYLSQEYGIPTQNVSLYTEKFNAIPIEKRSDPVIILEFDEDKKLSVPNKLKQVSPQAPN